jgi:peptide/nickel transport system substrate-binding protein
VTRRNVALLVVLALLAAGCRPEKDASLPELAADDSSPRSGGTLNRRLGSPVTSLNPVLVIDRYGTYVHRFLFTPLIDLSADLKPVPGLAEKWEIAPNNREYTFHLNRNATFSDKTPVRASDVLFTLRKILDPQSDALSMLAYFDQLDLAASRAVDDHTVLVVFREPLATQLIAFTNLFVLPEHVYGKGDFTKAHNDTAVGSGPYTLLRHVPGNEIVVQRREDYWARKPYIQTVSFKVIGADVTAWNALRLGQIDATSLPTETWLRERADTRSAKTLQFVSFYGLAYNCIMWNTRKPQFADKRMRHALAMSLNREAIISGLYRGTARIMNGHFVPELAGYNPEVKPIQYDLEGARKILTSLGWLDTNADGVVDKDGKPLAFELMITGGGPATALAQLFQADLQKIGVKLNVSVVDFAAVQQRMMNGNYDSTYMSWDLDPDPDPYPMFHSSQMPPRGMNYSFYSNPEVDRLIEAGRREFDAGKRAELYRQLHAALSDDPPFAWTVQPAEKWVLARRVRNAKVGNGYGLFLWSPGELDWWLADAKPSSAPSQATTAAVPRS